MPPVGFEPTISAGERPQTYALERAATGTGFCHEMPVVYAIITIIHNLSCVSRQTKSWNDMGYKGTALVILNSILRKKDAVSPLVQPRYSLDRKLTGTHSMCAPRSGEEKSPLSLLGIEHFALARGQVSALTVAITCRATAQRLVAGLSSRRLSFNPRPVYVHSVQQKSIGVIFRTFRSGSDVTYNCHHNSSRFSFPIFAHSWRFSVFHSLQSITPHIY